MLVTFPATYRVREWMQENETDIQKLLRFRIQFKFLVLEKQAWKWLRRVRIR
jgi:hypothetical protein